jgi:3-dehydroquinate synthase
VETQVRHATGTYPVWSGAGAVERLPKWIANHHPRLRPVMIADAAVASLHPAVLPGVPRHTFPSGESSKQRDTWAALTDALLTAGHDRHTLIVALGGGVTTDLAGFVAATLMRGVPWIAVPTTTLAMIDAAIGGKTGLDTSHGKNLVGAFHPPLAVFADTALLSTLPDAHFIAGLAEAVKHAAIASATHWQWLTSHADEILARDPGALDRLIADSARIKAEVVSADERETGHRAILNAGHTLGHAIEHASEYRLPHGHAVAIGLLLETRLGERLGVTEAGTARGIERLLSQLQLPTAVPILLPRERIAGALTHDKKNRDGNVRTVLLRRIGEVARGAAGDWTHQVPVEDLLP